MEEVASSMGDAGLPEDFHHGAANIYGRLAELKNAQPELDAIIAELLK